MKFMKNNVKFLGDIIIAEGIKPDMKKVKSELERVFLECLHTIESSYETTLKLPNL